MLLLKERPQLEVPYSIHTNLSLSERPSLNEFQRPVAVDLVPPGKVCDWCDQTAERAMTAIGGRFHNRSGLFCTSCGERFVQEIIHSS